MSITELFKYEWLRFKNKTKFEFTQQMKVFLLKKTSRKNEIGSLVN